jgi:hypothetical protein
MSFDNLFSSKSNYLDDSFEVHAMDDHDHSSSRYFANQDDNESESQELNKDLYSFIFRLMKRESDKNKPLKEKKSILKKKSSSKEDIFSKFL